MKKNIIGILLLPVFLMGSYSCSRMLEVEPENTPTFYNFFKTEKDIQSVMTGAYSDYRNQHTNVKRYTAGELADDYNWELLESFINLDPAEINSSLSQSSWYNYYILIQQTLLVTENVDRVDMPQERKDYWIGQALFYRALTYFEIVREWGDCPVITDANKVEPLARTPWRKVLDMAIEDMEEASKLLGPWATLKDASGAPIRLKQIPGKEAAWAKLAHMYAWKANLAKDEPSLQKAIDAATLVIEKGGFVLAENPEAVCNDVMAGGDPESIFELDIDFRELMSTNCEINIEVLYQTYPWRTNSSIGDVAGYIPSMRIKAERVLKMYAEYSGGVDLRRDAYFYKPAEMIDSAATEGWALMQKRRIVLEDRETYPNYPEMWFVNFGGNAILNRLADIILLRAECYAKKGQDNLAIADLNRVRDRAKAKSYSSTEGSVYRMIFEEREKELLCERHRWYDLVRTGYWKTDISPAFSALTEQDVEDGALYLPVHSGAFSLNPLMLQNRYWDKKH